MAETYLMTVGKDDAKEEGSEPENIENGGESEGNADKSEVESEEKGKEMIEIICRFKE